MTVKRNATEFVPRWLFMTACAGPVLSLLTTGYVHALHSINPTISVQTFVVLSAIKRTLPQLASIAWAISLAVCFTWVLDRLFHRHRRVFVIVLAATGMLLLAFIFLLLTAQSSALGPFIYAI